ncbi:MAG: site-specific integrase [Solirubrobacteraceae bacterium]|nr:site-specific integrase [Solirubrobacteraceae bacterium]
MARAPREQTRWPAIYKRGKSYEYLWRDVHGRQRSGTARTLDEARKTKAAREREAEHGHTYDAGLTFASYATDWIDRYQGRTARGFRENTRNGYRQQIETYAVPYFGDRQKLATITPRRISEFILHLTTINKGTEEKPKYLSDATIRRIIAPVRACLATAVEEGLLPANPCAGVRLPNRPQVEDTDDQVKALTTTELAALLQCAPAQHRTLLELLAATGLRISEAAALRWRDLRLDGNNPVVKVRRAYVKGTFGPPKTKYGKRDVPLPHALVLDLRRRHRDTDFDRDDDLVFGRPDGTPYRPENLSRPAIKLAAEEAGVPWAAFHTLRHTCATRLFAAGRNAVQVQRWLGHHSPAFTLATYVHLLDDDLGGPIDLPDGDSMETAEHPETTGNPLAA